MDNGNGPVPAQYSDPLTDLLIDPANANKLTTSTGGFFDETDVGRTVQITGGAGFNVGLVQVITAVDVNGEASGAAPWGTAGSGLGTGIEWIGYRTWTDLELLAAPVLLSSASRPFGPSDIGTKITISAGVGWTAGTYTIAGMQVDYAGNPTGAAILDRVAGTPGALGGVGTSPAELVTAFQGSYIDGYGFICPYPLTKSIFYSGAPDGTPDLTMWDPLNFFQKVRYPDNVSALFADHEELYTAGDLECTEVWRNVGDANNPFMPDPGAIMHLGVQAPFSFTRLGNGVAWIAQDTRREQARRCRRWDINRNPYRTPRSRLRGANTRRSRTPSRIAPIPGARALGDQFPHRQCNVVLRRDDRLVVPVGILQRRRLGPASGLGALRGCSRRNDGRALRRGLGERQHLHHVARLPDRQRIHHGATAQIAPQHQREYAALLCSFRDRLRRLGNGADLLEPAWERARQDLATGRRVHIRNRESDVYALFLRRPDQDLAADVPAATSFAGRCHPLECIPELDRRDMALNAL